MGFLSLLFASVQGPFALSHRQGNDGAGRRPARARRKHGRLAAGRANLDQGHAGPLLLCEFAGPGDDLGGL